MPGFTTDKVGHGFLPVYLHIAAQIGTHGHVCEVGVAGGDSLTMWQHLFPNGLVVGVDNGSLAPAKWPQGTIRVDADMMDPDLAQKVSDAVKWHTKVPFDALPHATFDVVVEDAVHRGKESAACLDSLWPLVSPGGWYVIEDWYVGFPSWSGYDTSMLSLAEGLLGALEFPAGTYRDSREGRSVPSDVEEIVYRYGMIILRKAMP